MDFSKNFVTGLKGLKTWIFLMIFSGVPGDLEFFFLDFFREFKVLKREFFYNFFWDPKGLGTWDSRLLSIEETWVLQTWKADFLKFLNLDVKYRVLRVFGVIFLNFLYPFSDICFNFQDTHLKMPFVDVCVVK